MKDIRKRRCRLAGCAAMCPFLIAPLLAAQDVKLPPREVEQIAKVIPERPAVVPKQARRILVFSRAWGYRHSAIPYGKKALELLGEKTGAFEAVIRDDDRDFEPRRLSGFDAVVFNNTNNEIFLPENFEHLSPADQERARKRDAWLKKSLVDFLAGGKGLVVIHAGIASFRKWPEFGKIMGARFDNHPWNAGSTVTIKVDDPDHPLTRAFPRARFRITDEIYQFKGRYSRKNLRVLLSLDTARTDMSRGKAIHRKDGDFALSWVKSYGKGRVFYCALGHQHDLYWNPALLRYFLDGIQFAIGDLKADTTPSQAP